MLTTLSSAPLFGLSQISHNDTTMTLVSADKGRVVARQREREGGLKRAILTLNTLNREAGGGAGMSCNVRTQHYLHTSALTQPSEYHTIEMMIMMFIITLNTLNREARGGDRISFNIHNTHLSKTQPPEIQT